MPAPSWAVNVRYSRVDTPVSKPFSTAVNRGLLFGRMLIIAVTILFSTAVNHGSLFGRRLNNAVTISHFGMIAISRPCSTALEQVFGRAYRKWRNRHGKNYRATLKQCQRLERLLESEGLRMMTMVFMIMIAVVLAVAVVVAVVLVIVVVEVW